MPTPRICVTVAAPTMAELRARRDAVADADLVELRLDSVRDPDVNAALAGRRRPVILTCRPAWEGGDFRGSEEERRRLLAEALELGAEYVDVEWRAGFDDLVARGGQRIVLSTHDFDGVPDDLHERARAMRGTTAGVVKVAVKASRLRDCVTLLDLGRSQVPGKAVLIGMGQQGLATRVLAGRFGSAWTYAGSLKGLGQLTPATLVGDYRFTQLQASTALYGIVGSPITHSISPAMHNAAFGAASLDAVYLPLPAADADDFVTFARAFEVKGASVTIPFKVALFDHVDQADGLSRKVGAINTLRMNDRWSGTNTDVAGFLAPLRQRRTPLTGSRAAILGAGGAARAVAVGLVEAGARVCVHARQRGQAARIADLVSGDVGAWPPEPRTWDLMVNTTPVGTYPDVDASPVPPDVLTGRVVYDLVYNPSSTRLLRDAAQAGCETIGGLDMLVAQAEEQFRYWHGEAPAPGVMREAAARRLAEFATHEAHVI
jgi:3-dehydroquinate dehydratase/shikimate dehydrogenase